MPFSLSELVGMSLKLKEVSLGLVELAFPDSRPSVKDQYKSAVHPDEDSVPSNTTMWAHLFKVKHNFVYLKNKHNYLEIKINKKIIYFFYNCN